MSMLLGDIGYTLRRWRNVLMRLPSAWRWERAASASSAWYCAKGLALAGIGLVLGLIGAYFVGRGMQSTLFGVHALDSSAFGLVGLVLLPTALLACFLPARRAASVEPMQALRTE